MSSGMFEEDDPSNREYKTGYARHTAPPGFYVGADGLVYRDNTIKTIGEVREKRLALQNQRDADSIPKPKT